jgi:DNA-binding transcriptional ArsR family regulator
MNIEPVLRAIASRRRIQILDWLKAPIAHFPPQVDGDLIKDGVCGLLIARKLRVSQPTASAHLNILVQAGLVKGKRMGKWTFYRRNEAGINAMKRIITRTI